jgi:Uma2 family endonuclease
MSHGERQQLLVYLRRAGEFLFPSDRVEEPRPAYGAALKYMTREEFFQFQEQSTITYEYINGIIRAMSGPTVAHCLITQNIFRVVDARLRGGPCHAFCTGGPLNLTLDDDEIVYHPDVYVSCDRHAWDQRGIPNPKFVVEVLSPSTQHIDRREKLVNYCRVPSLDEYVIVSQHRMELAIYRRSANWSQEIVSALEATVEFRSLDVTAPVAAIYEEVTFKTSR